MSKRCRNLLVLATVLLIVVAAACAPAAPTPTPTPTAAPTPTPTPTALFLKISEPEDGSEVGTSAIFIRGNTIPEAVVSISINDALEIADVDERGHFTVTVTLEQGPNSIEVIASDQRGNQISSILAVFYNP